MDAAQGFVTLIGALPNGAAHAVFEPTLYKRADGHSAGICGDTLVGLCQGLCKLPCSLGTGLGIDGLARFSCGRFDRVAGHIQPVTIALGDAALSVTALTHRLLPSAVREARWL